MGIISRFKQIMAANFNALLDKAEDPEKMIDQYLRELNEDFAQLKSETASIMADEKAAKRKLDECDAEIIRMDEYAKKAVSAGNDGDAKSFLRKGNDLRAQREVLALNYVQCADAATKMRQMHDKLASDIDSLNTRKATLKAKLKLAEAQNKLNQLGSSAVDAGATMTAFEELEAKVDKLVDKAEAMSELNQAEAGKTAETLAQEYDLKAKDEDLDAQLAALKVSMGVTVE